MFVHQACFLRKVLTEPVCLGSLEHDPLRTHVFVYNVHKGVMVKPFDWLLTNSNV